MMEAPVRLTSLGAMVVAVTGITWHLTGLGGVWERHEGMDFQEASNGSVGMHTLGVYRACTGRPCWAV